MSFCVLKPRLGTLPRGAEKVSSSFVRFNSRTATLGGAGGAGSTGLVKVVVVGATLFGRKMVFKPGPVNDPVKLAKIPRGGRGSSFGGGGTGSKFTSSY